MAENIHNKENTLHIVHNAGFFSCSSIALEQTMIYFNQNKKLPTYLNREKQYQHYKNEESDNLIPILFKESENEFEYVEDVRITFDKTWFQFTDYKLLDFNSLKPFTDRYFAPSDIVLNRIAELEAKYNIDYDKTVGILYRGNDKQKECKIASYRDFILKAHELNGIDTMYLIQPDETEFLTSFKDTYPNTIHPTEWQHMPKDSNTAIFMHLKGQDRVIHAINVLASIIMLSKCKDVITGTGNMSMWLALYRGNTIGFHQWKDNNWL